MDIAVFGTGYVGLVTAACMADVGHRVTCVDIDQKRIESLQAGEMPIFEPGLADLVNRNLRQNRLSFTVDAAYGVGNSEAIFIAVGTPSTKDGSADLSHVLTVARTIARHMDGYRLVIGKSTVPVGTGDRLAEEIEQVLRRRGVNIPFDVCSNPEFLKEGSAIEDFTRAARIVVGTDSERVRQLMIKYYAPYNRNHDKLMFMDRRSAELTKYAANAMLATKISFMNEIANLAERIGADIERVRQGIGSDPRIGYNFIYPGCGYGGSCLPKDVAALCHTARQAGIDPLLLRAVDTINDQQKTLLFQKLLQVFDGKLSGKRIAVWGLAFKPNTDDIREAPSRDLVEALWKAGATISAFDPQAGAAMRAAYGARADLELAESPEKAVPGADALVICTEWREFRVLDFDWLKSELKHPIIIDGRNLYDPVTVAEHGLLYYAVGRGASARLYQENMASSDAA